MQTLSERRPELIRSRDVVYGSHMNESPSEHYAGYGTSRGKFLKRGQCHESAIEISHPAMMCFTSPMKPAEERARFRELAEHRAKASEAMLEMHSCRGHAGLMHRIQEYTDAAQSVRSVIIESNLRLVVSIARKYAQKSSVPLDDLIGAGNTALLNAVDGFDYTRGFRFSTYAYKAISRTIAGQLRSEFRAGRCLASDSHDFIDSAIKDASEPECRMLRAKEAHEEVLLLLGNLAPREQTVILERFGIGRSENPKTFAEISTVIGVSKQRTAAIYAEAIQKLRKFMQPV